MKSTETEVTAPGAPGVPPVTLRLTEHGDRSAATHVLLLHGYPDDRTLWDDVLPGLPDDWHVVTPDNRGAGRSDVPGDRAAYDVARLVADVVAVVDATAPEGEQVHLVGHDWGAIIGWDVVAAATHDPRLAGRLASFTSVCGFPLDHLYDRLGTWPGRVAMTPQLLHSWYAFMFCVPRLPELLWGRGQGVLRRLADRLDPTARLLDWGPDLGRQGVTGLGLYRRNVVRRPRAWRTDLPVQVVLARDDAFIRPVSLEGLEARCTDHTRVELDTGHWVPRSEPARLAELVVAHVRAHGG